MEPLSERIGYDWCPCPYASEDSRRHHAYRCTNRRERNQPAAVGRCSLILTFLNTFADTPALMHELNKKLAIRFQQSLSYYMFMCLKFVRYKYDLVFSNVMFDLFSAGRCGGTSGARREPNPVFLLPFSENLGWIGWNIPPKVSEYFLNKIDWTNSIVVSRAGVSVSFPFSRCRCRDF